MNSEDIKPWIERMGAFDPSSILFEDARSESVKAEISELRHALEAAEAERDQWAAKWQAVRRELAQARYPGMTKTVRALSKEKP